MTEFSSRHFQSTVLEFTGVPQVPGGGLGWAAEGPDSASAITGADGPLCALRCRCLLANVSDVKISRT